jgi:hypothetical protein
VIVQIIKDGEKNFSVLVKGVVSTEGDLGVIVDVSKLAPPRAGFKGLRLDSAAWAIQEKMGLHLWWEASKEEKDFLLVMESRNGMRFDEGIPSPRIDKDKWGGQIHLSCFRLTDSSTGPIDEKYFILLLDFDKQ